MSTALQILGLYAAIGLAAALAAWRLYRRYAHETVSALPLAVFRIAYGSVLFLEVGQLFRFRHLVFDPIPYVEPGAIELGYALAAWLVAIVCLVAGLWTRTAAVVSYVLTLATFSTFGSFEYHLDYILTGVNGLLVIAPVSRRLSVDRWLEARAGSPAGPAERIPRLYPELFVLVGIGLVYFDSVFYKLASPMWTSGLGVWLPASLPQVTWLDLSPVLDREWLVLGLGYLTLVFESLFLFLVWFDRLRPALLVVGLGLHLGITAAFPIPWFGLAVVALYVLLVPPAWFERAERWMRGTAARAGAGLPLAERPLPEGAGLLLLLGWILVSQGLVTLQAPLTARVAEALRLQGAQARAAQLARPYTQHVARPLAGIVGHGVFMDRHFHHYEQMISIVHVDDAGRETWLPLYGPDGLATAANSGRNWVFWNWRAVGSRPDATRLAEGTRRYTAFWAHRQGLPLRDLRFEVRARAVETPVAWERGWLRRQRERPWRTVGTAGWRDGRFWSRIGPLPDDAAEVAATRETDGR